MRRIVSRRAAWQPRPRWLTFCRPLWILWRRAAPMIWPGRWMAAVCCHCSKASRSRNISPSANIWPRARPCLCICCGRARGNSSPAMRIPTNCSTWMLTRWKMTILRASLFTRSGLSIIAHYWRSDLTARAFMPMCWPVRSRVWWCFRRSPKASSIHGIISLCVRLPNNIPATIGMSQKPMYCRAILWPRKP